MTTIPRSFPAIAASALGAAAIVGLVVGVVTATPSSVAASTSGAGATPAGTASATPTGDVRLTADISPSTAAPMATFEISGRVSPVVDGVGLQVQRRQGDEWRDFPVTTSTRGDGTYSVTLKSGRDGDNAFRVVGRVDGHDVASPEAVVRIG